MKVYDSYVAVLKAIDCYDDAVLLEARDLALALCANTNVGWDSLLDELNAQFEDDCRAIGVWDPEEEVCTDDERLGRVMGRAHMQTALGMLDAEQPADAIVELMFGMLQRSIAYERMYC
jgi:hypothetical protein